MSTRPASPPPSAPWPFYASAGLLFALGAYFLVTAGRPPAVPPLIAAMFCMGGSILASLIPTILEYDRRLRLAEAAVRDAADAQLRRLAQTADQLAHAVSRSQSTEEQAGRALGTLEEVAERLVAQADELAATLTRTAAREGSSHAEELQRLVDERDEKLTGLEIRLNASSLALTETQAAIKKSSVATQRAIDSLATRLEELSEQIREALAARPAATPVIAPPPPEAVVEEPVIETQRPAEPPPAETSTESEPESSITEVPVAPVSVAEPTESTDTPEAIETPVSRPPRRPRHHDPAEPSQPEPAADAAASTETPVKPAAPLELALEGMPEPRPVMRLNRREPPGSTSLVATAYIGIGNKLFVRGDGPGLSWETGVPMQFLAIGKWGWTTTEATAPVTCRVYRNDDTPMLEENAVIDPGTKTEITPRF